MPCVIQHSVAHSHDNALKIRKLAPRERLWNFHKVTNLIGRRELG